MWDQDVETSSTYVDPCECVFPELSRKGFKSVPQLLSGVTTLDGFCVQVIGEPKIIGVE